jgi:serine phosphatase RsbU (regulator of sigma subunit)
MLDITHIVKSSKDNTLEHRLFNAGVFTAGVVYTFTAAQNFYMGLGVRLSLICFFLAVLNFAIYFVSRMTSNFRIFILPSLILNTIINGIQWFSNGGSAGGVQYFYFVLALAWIILIRPKQRPLFFGLFLAFVLLLVVLEYHYPDWLVAYESRRDRYIDVGFSFIMAMIFSALLIDAVMKSYGNVNRKLIFKNKLIDEEILRGKSIQEKCLPESLPSFNNMDISTTFLPMEEVAGDFYDIREIGGKRYFFIADVSGHGLASAFLALVARTSYVHTVGTIAPSKVLERVNASLLDVSVQGMFMTAFMGIVDKNNENLTIYSAGHPVQLLLRRSDCSIGELHSRGTALGVRGDINIMAKVISLEPHDRLVLFTDGITETENRHREIYGYRRLKDFLLEHEKESPDVLSDELMNDLRKFRESDVVGDDITLIAVDFKDSNRL